MKIKQGKDGLWYVDTKEGRIGGYSSRQGLVKAIQIEKKGKGGDK